MSSLCIYVCSFDVSANNVQFVHLKYYARSLAVALNTAFSFPLANYRDRARLDDLAVLI